MQRNLVLVVVVIVSISLGGGVVYTFTTGQITSITNENAKLQTDTNTLQNQINTLSSEKTQLQNQVNTLTSDQTATEQQILKINVEKDNLQSKYDLLQNQIALTTIELNNEINVTREINTELKNNIETLNPLTFILNDKSQLDTSAAYSYLSSPSYYLWEGFIERTREQYVSSLDYYRRVLDTCSNPSITELTTAITNIEALSNYLQPNTNLTKAKTFHYVVYLYDEVAIKLDDGSMISYTITDEENNAIKNLYIETGEEIFDLSRGEINFVFEFKIIPIPLTKITENSDGSIWFDIGDEGLSWASEDFEKYDTTYLYYSVTMYSKDGFRQSWGGMNYGWYSLCPYNPSWGTEYFKLVLIHEWLHGIDWMMLCVGYPQVPSSDGCRDVGYVGNDPNVDFDYRRPAGETEFLGYYTHIIQGHLTPRMWDKLLSTVFTCH